MRQVAWLAAVAAILMASPGRGAAGPVEQFAQFGAHPVDPDVMVLRHEYGGEGLIFTRDGGASWRLMCGSALKPSGLTQTLSRLGRVAFDDQGVLHMGTFGGMLRDDGTGCAWMTEGPFADQWVSDVTHHPTDASTLFAITSSGGEGKKNGVYRRVGPMGDWEAVGSQDAILISRLHVVALGGGKLRFYQGAVHGMLGMAPNFKPNYVVRVSDDLGKTWTEHAFGETDGSVRLEAVDPTNPDRIVVVLDHEGTAPGLVGASDELLVSDDQGASFTKWASVVAFGGLAIAPDGRAWFGDHGDLGNTESDRGVFAAANVGAKPTLLNGDLHVACLHYLPTSKRLFACDLFEAGTLDPSDGAYTKNFAFKEVESFLDCPGRDFCAECERQLVGAWCGVSHFPEADLCCCYSAEAKGIDARNLSRAEAEALLCPGESDAGGGGGSDASADAGGSGGTGGASATGGTGGDAGVGGTGGAPVKDDGGCSCGTPGAPREASASCIALVALGFVAFGRTRRARC